MDRTLKNRFHPAFDPLDARRLMAAHLTATLAHGVLTVKGTPAADIINVDAEQGVVVISGLHKTFSIARIKRIDVLGGKGNDTINVENQNFPVRINGGAGNDTINGVSDIPSIAIVPTVPTVPSTPQPPTPTLSTTTQTPSTPPATSPVVSVPSVSAAVQRIIDLTNAQRVQAGLAPLALSAPLTQAAEIQSGNMARLDIMSHILPGTNQPNLTDRAAAVGYDYSTLGENIAYNYADADAVVAGWMASPGHRANILNTSFTEIGVSIAYNAKGEPYYTQVFGKPMSA